MLKQRWFPVSGIVPTRDQWLSLLYDTDIGEQTITLPGGAGTVRLQPVQIPKDIPLIPPWQVEHRLGDESFQQYEQGHGFHGWWESGGEGKPAPDQPTVMANVTPPPLDLNDPSWNTNGQAPDEGAYAQCVNQKGDGFTLSTKDGSTPITGFNVGHAPVPGYDGPINLNTGDPIAAGVAMVQYAEKNKELLDKPENYLGGWRDDDGNFVVEVSENISKPEDAGKAAVERNQNSFWDNAQAKENADVRASGINKDGTPYVAPAEGAKDSLPDPLQLSGGTGVFGAPNPYAREGVAAGKASGPNDPTATIVGPNGEGRISPNVEGRQQANSVGMSQAWRDKADSVMEKAEMPDSDTRDANANAMLDNASAQQWANGLTDYGHLNADAHTISKETNGVVSAYAAAGVIAALSPRTSLGSNVGGAHFVAQAVASNMVMHFDPQALADYNAGLRAQGEQQGPSNIQNDTPLLSQPSRDDAAAAIMLYSTQNGLKEDPQYAEKNADGSVPGLTWSGKDGVGKAIEIAAGFKYGVNGLTDQVATPDNTLGASGPMKERDFFNNIIDPNDTLSTTVDGWMVGGIKGTGEYNPKIEETEKKNSEAYKAVMSAPQSKKDNYGRAGCYPLFVDSIEKAAEAHGIIPQEAQAVGWEYTRDTAKGREQTAGNVMANKALPPAMEGVMNPASPAPVPVLANAVAQRPLMSNTATRLAFAKQYPDMQMPGNLWAVKCNDGTCAFAGADPEMDTLIDGDGDTDGFGQELGGFSVYGNAENLSNMGMTLPAKEDIQTVLSAVADLHERDPLNWSGLGYTNGYIGKFPDTFTTLPNGNQAQDMTLNPIPPMTTLRGPLGAARETGMNPVTSGLQAWTSPTTPGQICINAGVLSKDVGSRPSYDTWHMPVSQTMSSPQYTALHEYGHLKEFSTHNESAMGVNTKVIPADVKNAFVAAQRYSAHQSANSPSAMSQYGKENAHEGYAEAYTEVMGSHGATDNSVAKIYDRVFNWTGTHPEGTTGIILQPDKIAQDFLSGAGPDSPGTITINKENHA